MGFKDLEGTKDDLLVEGVSGESLPMVKCREAEGLSDGMNSEICFKA